MTSDPVKKIQNVIKKAIDTGKASEAALKASKGEIVQLPLWRDEVRGIPNEIVRSAIFNVGNPRTKRAFFEKAQIAVIGDAEITYTGIELRQDDEDVWLQILHLSRMQEIGSCVEFSPYSMLKVLKWHPNGHYKKKLKDTIDRLIATNLSMFSKRLGEGISVSLIHKFVWTDRQNIELDRWCVYLDLEIKEAFGELHYTQLEWDQRLKLTPFEKWLHGYYASHKQSYPLKLNTIQAACGSAIKDPYKFKQLLKKSVNKLVEIGFLTAAEIKDGKLYIFRKSQS